jgi:phospholipid/cholesterol/gamma-HCH transport system substrate-binding protein
MFGISRIGRRARVVAAALVLVLLTGTGAWLASRGPAGRRITAYFTTAVGVYAGSDLRILGVKVGTVDAVRLEGTQVKVTMTLRGGVAVPANVDAVIVAPSIIADRYVQLSPAYTGGPRLAAGAVIPAARTATPVELDQLYDSIRKLTTALGPNGANAHGSLSDLLNTGAANLNGNGEKLGDTIKQFGRAARTLSGSSDDLFGTIDNLQKFTTMLRNNDGQVRRAEQQLADVSGFLAADRDDLAAALEQLATALRQVKTFIQSNRAHITSNVDKLASLTQTLINQRASLAEALDVLPLAADNLLNAYDPATGTLNGRADLNELSLGPGAAQPASAAASAPTAASAPASRLSSPPPPPLPLPPAGPVSSSGSSATTFPAGAGR